MQWTGVDARGTPVTQPGAHPKNLISLLRSVVQSVLPLVSRVYSRVWRCRTAVQHLQALRDAMDRRRCARYARDTAGRAPKESDSPPVSRALISLLRLSVVQSVLPLV
jgi:hypothetical protein